TGTVSISDGTGGTCTATLPANSCVLASDSAGVKTLTLSYGGDGNFNISTTTAGHLVNRAETTTTIISDNPDPSAPGQSVAVNFSVVPNLPGFTGPSDALGAHPGQTAVNSAVIVPTGNVVVT